MGIVEVVDGDSGVVGDIAILGSDARDEGGIVSSVFRSEEEFVSEIALSERTIDVETETEVIVTVTVSWSAGADRETTVGVVCALRADE